MNSRELRVGNILREKYTGDKLVVSELTKDRITFDYITTEKWQAEPIPITEEILLKCGFEELPLTNYRIYKTFKVGKRYLYFDKSDCVWYLNNDENISYCNNIDSVEYLHELQNVYYWSSKDDYMFKREELEIKL